MTRTRIWSVGTFLLVAALALGAAPNRAGAWGVPPPSYHGYIEPLTSRDFGENYRSGWSPYYNYNYNWSYRSADSRYRSSSSSTSYFDKVPSERSEFASANNNADYDSRAHITVLVPDPNADVIFNGRKTNLSGTERNFQSPELTPGIYRYEVQASWKANGRTITRSYTVRVRPGARSMVDFMDE